MFGKTTFYIKHRDTGMYLYTDTGSKFNEHNCRRCPIVGHSEISCASGKTKNAIWKVHSGFYFPVNSDVQINYEESPEEDVVDYRNDDL